MPDDDPVPPPGPAAAADQATKVPAGRNPPPDEETLDATLSESETAPTLDKPEVSDYNPEKSRDAARGRITYWLLSLLTLLVVGSFITLWATAPSFANLKTLLDVILGPIVALVSAATGFYFGANSSSKAK